MKTILKESADVHLTWAILLSLWSSIWSNLLQGICTLILRAGSGIKLNTVLTSAYPPQPECSLDVQTNSQSSSMVNAENFGT